ncbi:ABC transporter substrate-binding protein [Haloactinopolyspora alba]|nr:ABC transporter substrate-binding protein [Haloactinopolyspora alba]
MNATRTRFFMCGAVAVSLGLTGCAADSGATTTEAGITEISLTSQPNETGFAQWLADELGYYEDNGLDVDIEYASSGPAALAAGSAGDWQAGWTGGPPALTGWDKFELISVGTQLREDTNLILFISADALEGSSPAEVLAAEPVATVANSTSSQMLFACAESLGVSDENLEVVPLDPPGVIQAMQAGRVVAGTGFSSPNWPLVSSDEYVQVCNGAEAGTAIVDPWIVTKSFWEQQPEAAAAFVDASYRAASYINQNPDKAVEHLLDFYEEVGVEGSREQAAYALSVREWLSLEEAVQAADNGATEDAMQGTADFFVDQGVYLTSPDVPGMVTQGREVLEAATEYRQRNRP